MTDIVNTLRGGFCEPNTGCMSVKTCICDLLGDAADEIERLRERRDDWRAAMAENHDLWNENERLREKMKNIIEWCDKLLSHKPMPKPFAEAIKEGRAALGEASDDAAP